MRPAILAKSFRSVPWKWAVGIAVAMLLLGWLLNTPEGLLGKADAVGYAVCHRIDLRSFHLGDRQMPLCARCSGMYLGAVLGLFFMAVISPRHGRLPSGSVLWVLILLVLAFGLDGINSFLSLLSAKMSLYEPQNWLRLLTGTGMGLVIAAFLYPAFNQTIWKDWNGRPAIGGLKWLGVLVLLAALLDLLVLTENWLILYPLALISAGGVVLILTMVYSMLYLIIRKMENRYHSVVQLGTTLVIGFGLALLQIAFLDGIRYYFTGTWDGFHLG